MTKLTITLLRTAAADISDTCASINGMGLYRITPKVAKALLTVVDNKDHAAFKHPSGFRAAVFEATGYKTVNQANRRYEPAND